MKQIYELSEEELRMTAADYMRCGVWSRAAMCMERMLFLGVLPRYGYVRLVALYVHSGNRAAARRIMSRYCKLRKY